jgi:glycosyltransferase involved in cell wall biosynthesis
MIVKNESQVIIRCLESVAPLVDYVLIEDTGSTDGTQTIIREWLDRRRLPGEVVEEPWRDFAYNRSHALARLRENKNIDYAFMIDADDQLVIETGFDVTAFKKSLFHDLYKVRWHLDLVFYDKPQICSNKREFWYRGVLHEFLEGPPEGFSSGNADGFYILVGGGEGARSQDPNKYRKDAEALEQALQTEQDALLRSRYTFYLARSYRDAGEQEKALDNFLKRVELGYWSEEIFDSLLNAASLLRAMGRPFDEVIAMYLRASDAAPNRAEALHAASRLCRENKNFADGFEYASRGLKIPLPANGLFVQLWVYDYGLLDELAVNAYWAEHYQDCIEACQRLLREGKMPQDKHDRVKKNAEFAAEKLRLRDISSSQTPLRTPHFSEPMAGDRTMTTGKVLCLNMIVKNESHVILRCLESVRPLVDHVLIEDTGSSDGTQTIIREWLNRVGMPGEVFEEPWRDFAYNRSHALARLHENKSVDYALIMDADDQLVVEAGFDVAAFKSGLSKDLYFVEMRHSLVHYQRGQIYSNKREFRYRGVLHEFLEGPSEGFSSGNAAGFYIISSREGARSQDPDKYRKDAQVLEQALQAEQDPFLRSRYTFYLARSYRDAGEKEKALDNYLKRAELGYWSEEIFESLFGAAQLLQAMGRPFDEVIAMYLRASDAAPSRAEALHAASVLCRESNKFADGFEYARRGLKIPAPTGGLFVQPWVYEYGLLDELAVNAYWIEQYQDSLEACQRLLNEGKMPQDMYDRVKKNAEFAAEKLRPRDISTSQTPSCTPHFEDSIAGERTKRVGKALCLNMIVKNEMANLERCLEAVAPYIACWVIGDTDSTDGTQDFIKSFFAKRDIPGELHSFPFVNFEQARNAALDCAYASPLVYDYLLLADADMELVVEDRDFRAKLEAPGYRVIQRSSLTYWNTRIVRRDAGVRYRGVTHEYLDVPGGAKELRGVLYKDHASGSNRVDKFERDIRLLTEALKAEPKNDRYWFYLAQSYKDAGRTAEAAEAYAKRAEMGGWDEEVWRARLEEARCHRKLGDEGGFLRQALAAFNQRPQRAEPLYDLARFYRERGMNDVSLLFSEAGLGLKRPDGDILFIEDFVYQAGLTEEYSIAANYSRDPARKDRGFAACNWLALNREVPAGTRNLARHNLRFYVEPADKMMPSFSSREVSFTPPEGYRALNPSVARHGDQLVLVQRCVNFVVTDGKYLTPDGGPIKTRNFLLRLDDDLRTLSAREILPPRDMPTVLSQRIQGFEDARLFSWRNELWFSACFRELNVEALAEQALVRIDESEPGECRLHDLQMLRPDASRQAQKNWMPCVTGDALQFIYLCDPTRLVDQHAQTTSEVVPPIAAEEFRGGSQAIPFDGGWLALIHEVGIADRVRHYHHRFVWFDGSIKLRSVSRPFFFEHRGIEYAAGLAWHPDGMRLVVSYGVDDSKSRIATVDVEEVRRLLEDVDKLPSGALSIEGRTTPLLSVAAAPAAAKETVVIKRDTTVSGEEEAWYALLQGARRLRSLNDEGGFVQQALAAFNQRPHRAEPLYDLAKHYRERGMTDASVLFSEPGLAIPWPKQDALFIEDFVYSAGLLEEYSIAANYAHDPARKDRGFAACNWLALSRHIPQSTRELARANIRFYVAPASVVMPSFTTYRVSISPPEGYRAMNPSVVRHGNELLMVQRAINYVITEKGGIQAPGDAFSTRNFLLRLSASLDVESSAEILPPEDLTDPAYSRVRGFEDVRPFVWCDTLWCSAATRELAPDGWHQQVLARIDESRTGQYRFADWRMLAPVGPRRYEKNWMPLVVGDALRFIYLCDPTRILDQNAQTVADTIPPIAAELFRGGSQAIAFENGWLALIHEVSGKDRQRFYHHRFVWLDETTRLRGVSRPFFLEHHGIEFAAGLAWHPDGRRLVVSYGIEDREAGVATVDAAEVRRLLDDANTLSLGNFPKDGRSSAKAATPLAVLKIPTPLKRTAPSLLHFIIGVPRSGTTLFRAMLGAHPSICAPSETPWLSGAYGASPSLRELLHNLVADDYGPVKNIQGVSTADVIRAAERFVLELFATKMQQEGKEILVLKTPDDIWFVDELIEFFPHAKILHLRRDVRDVALSTIERGWKTLNHYGDNNFANAVSRWIACETKIEQIAKTNTNVQSFRFEDLLEHPKAQLERATQILGVNFDLGMLDYALHLADAPAWEEGSRDVKRQPSLNPGRAWAHRGITPSVEQRQVIEANARKIEALGYSGGWL